MGKISVVTVCYNAVRDIEDTIISVVDQNYENIEYIVIDGGSTDGTVDIIRKYAVGGSEYGKHNHNIVFWVSEHDGGIYEAMNKGIMNASGDYINFMNAGDTFFSPDTIENVFRNIKDTDDLDVVFGDSVAVDSLNNKYFKYASPDVSELKRRPTYRHGASFVKTDLHKRNLFDLNKKDILGFALDYNCIFNLLQKGARFKKVDEIILNYKQEGESNNLIRSGIYNYRITHGANGKSIPFIFRIINFIKCKLLKSRFVKFVYYVLVYIMNNVIAHLPLWSIRRCYYGMMGIQIGKDTVVNMKQYILTPGNLKIGKNCHINRGCLIDARGWVYIDDNVSISYGVTIMTGSHDVNSSGFNGVYLPVVIGKNSWIGVNSTILQNVRIGEGAVVAAGAVVTTDVEPYTIVGGVPARKIGSRNRNLQYTCKWVIPFV